jgi:hypothetical protein
MHDFQALETLAFKDAGLVMISRLETILETLAFKLSLDAGPFMISYVLETLAFILYLDAGPLLPLHIWDGYRQNYQNVGGVMSSRLIIPIQSNII